MLLALAGVAAAGTVPVPHPKPRLEPTRPVADPDGDIDMRHAVPLGSLLHHPSTPEQYRAAATAVARDKPLVDSARTTSDRLAREAEALHRRLVAVAGRIEQLESERAWLDGEVARLTAENDRLSAGFARDRLAVTRLLAVLQRLQHDAPPAMAVRPGDALSAARGAMLIGASLPAVYGRAAELARRLETLRKTRAELQGRQAEAARNAGDLKQARLELDKLLAEKRLEAGAAAGRYGDLKKRFDKIAAEAVNLQALLQKVAQLRSVPQAQGVVTVTAQKPGRGRLARGSLLRPVVGSEVSGGPQGVGAPGLTYATGPGAQVIAPADGQVLFAEPYQKTGQVLILEMADGYDAVLAGLDRLTVQTGNRVLAGEPVGTMSQTSREPRLYFELRQNGRGISPAPYLAAALRKANEP